MSKNILKLTLHRQAFEVMVTGEKDEEYRAISPWIQARLFTNAAANRMLVRAYDLVEFTNGYGSSRPRFLAQFVGVEVRPSVQKTYSNGLQVVTQAVYVIKLGRIEHIENWPS